MSAETTTHLIWATAIAVMVITVAASFSVAIIYRKPATIGDAMATCAASSDARASAYCMKLAENKP
jgi:hypothetical protein